MSRVLTTFVQLTKTYSRFAVDETGAGSADPRRGGSAAGTSPSLHSARHLTELRLGVSAHSGWHGGAPGAALRLRLAGRLGLSHEVPIWPLQVPPTLAAPVGHPAVRCVGRAFSLLAACAAWRCRGSCSLSPPRRRRGRECRALPLRAIVASNSIKARRHCLLVVAVNKSGSSSSSGHRGP